MKGLGNKLGRLENRSPLSGGQASQSTPSSQKTTPVFTRPKRSARASKAMSVRTQLARYEQEDFTAELDAVMSEDEGPSPTTSPTKTARAATNRYTRHFGVQHAVPRIPVTTQQEEALMIRAMSKEEKQDVCESRFFSVNSSDSSAMRFFFRRDHRTRSTSLTSMLPRSSLLPRFSVRCPPMYPYVGRTGANRPRFVHRVHGPGSQGEPTKA